MITQRYPSDTQEQYMVRFPDGLRDVVKRLAKENMRSMNAEIVLALKAWVERQNEKSGTPA